MSTLNDSATELLALSEEHGLPQFRAVARMFLGWGQANAAGITLLEQELIGWKQMGLKVYLTRNMCLLAECCLLAGSWTEGVEVITEALALASQTKEQWYVAPLHLLRAELLLRAHGIIEAAETELQVAMRVARQQQAKSWELRAAMSMARLWRDQGKRDEARELLAPVYGWFTEGHDTRDLKEAKAFFERAYIMANREAVGELLPPEQSVDHLVSQREKFIRDAQTKRLGGLQVNQEIEFGRLLYRKVTGFGTL